eukprot:scaffold6913_cov110-Cylindrotheca_fusiformis.AAC.2
MTSRSISSGIRNKKNHVTVQSRALLVQTVDRLLTNEPDLTSITFGFDICPFLLRDDFMETLVQILRSSTHLRQLGLYIGRQCKRLTFDGVETIAEYIKTSPTLEMFSLEGDEFVSQKANHLLNAAARNPSITGLQLHSINLNQASSLHVSSWRNLSFYGCAFEPTSPTTVGRKQLSVRSLKIRDTCEPSMIAWLLRRMSNDDLEVLDIVLSTFPQKMIPCLCHILAHSTSSLRQFRFHISYSSDSHIRVCRNPNTRVMYDTRYDNSYRDATSEELTRILKSLETNTTLEHLSLCLPPAGDEASDSSQDGFASLRLHVQRNLNLESIGELSLSGLLPSHQDELRTIQGKNQLFLKQMEIGVDDCTPSLWPFLIERCLKDSSRRGVDAVFRRLSDHRIAPR